MKIFGMIHLLPLPGSPRFGGIEPVISRASEELCIYVDAGLDGVVFENYGDAPFYPGSVPPETISAMTHVIDRVVTGENVSDGIRGSMQIGVNVLRNDPIAALAIASVVDASFIRVNIHDGAMVTDQGIIEGHAHETLRYRTRIGAGDIRIFADARVKHATPLGPRSLALECDDLVERGLVDGLIFTGPSTGLPPDGQTLDLLEFVKDKHPNIEIIIGSGVNSKNARQIAEIIEKLDGTLIIGTAFKEKGITTNPVDPGRVESLVSLLR